ncbi:TPA: hypothetical protein PQS58_002007 [Staphylococcus aureus]|nr:hypothetical protein [Staphylococcus aureus]
MEIIKKEIKKKSIWFSSISLIILLSLVLFLILRNNINLINTVNTIFSLPISVVSMLLTIILYGKFEENKFIIKQINDETLKDEKYVVEFIKALKTIHGKLVEKKKYEKSNNILEISKVKSFLSYTENTNSDYAACKELIKETVQKLSRKDTIEDTKEIIILLSNIESVMRLTETIMKKGEK